MANRKPACRFRAVTALTLRRRNVLAATGTSAVGSLLGVSVLAGAVEPGTGTAVAAIASATASTIALLVRRSPQEESGNVALGK